MKVITDRTANPFGITPPCGDYVPGRGDPNADFHLVLDRPEATASAGPLGGAAWNPLRAVLDSAGLFSDGEPTDCFVSYRYPCRQSAEPTAAQRRQVEPVFDAELRAVTAHVLLPVGARAVESVLRSYTSTRPDDLDVEEIHGQEITSGSWIVLPIKDPAQWTEGDEQTLAESLDQLMARDYRRECDLGRHVTGGDAYIVR